MPFRIRSLVDDLQPYLPNAPQAFMIRDSEIVGPGLNRKNDVSCEYVG